MSMFDEPNKDAVHAGGDATGGASRGFIESTRDAYNASFKAMSQLGVSATYSQMELDQNNKIYKATGSYPQMDGTALWHDEAAKFYERGGTPETAAKLAKYDAHIAATNAAHPELQLRNSQDMWDAVKADAQKAEEIAASPGSTVGHFLGEAAAGLDPRVNPLNFATLGVGGVGKTVAGRVATEAGALGLVQVGNELTGVNTNRNLLGLETGFGQSAGRVAMAAATGGLVRGGLEGLSAGLGRLKGREATMPPPVEGTPPAPPTASIAAPSVPEAALTGGEQPLFRSFEDFSSQLSRQDIAGSVLATTQEVAGSSPYGKSRLATARHERDLIHIEAQLQDFRRNGPPRLSSTETAAVPNVVTSEMVQPHWLKTGDVRVPELARAADPELFAQLDKLEALAQREREVLRGTQSARASLPLAEVDAALAKADALETRIADLQSQIPGADPRKVKKLNGKIAKFEAEQKAVVDSISPHDHAAVSGSEDAAKAASQRLMEIEQSVRELAPLRQRAEAAAIEQYLSHRVTPETFNAFHQQLRAELNLGEREKPLAQARRPSEKLTAEQGGNDVTPGTPKRPATTSGPDPSETLGVGNAPERLLRDITHENANVEHTVNAAFEAAQAVKDGHMGEIVLGNRRYKLDDMIPIGVKKDATGKVIGTESISARDLLKEIGDDADMLASMRSCAL